MFVYNYYTCTLKINATIKAESFEDTMQFFHFFKANNNYYDNLMIIVAWLDYHTP